MPTTETFAYLKRFSPDDHCVVDMTTAEIEATGHARWEGSLEDVMALWWNLSSMDITVVSGSSQSRDSMPVKALGGEPISDLDTEPTATPRDRVCAGYGDVDTPDALGPGVSCGSEFADPFTNADVAGNWVQFRFVRVCFNTDTENYALLYDLLLGQGPEGDQVGTYSNVQMTDVNGGTITFMGQAASISYRQSTLSDSSITVDNPVYYTYI